MTNAEARCNKSLRPRKPEGSLGRTAQDVHLDSHTAPELWGVVYRDHTFKYSATSCLRNVCFWRAMAGKCFFSFYNYYYEMVSEIFPITASDQYAEKKLIHYSECTTGRFSQRKTYNYSHNHQLNRPTNY